MFTVLGILLQLPICYSERSDPMLLPHLQIQAAAIEQAAATPEDKAALIAIGYSESRFCWSVANGSRSGGYGQGPWQIEPGSNRAPPFKGVTVETLAHAAAEALWLWHHSQCSSMPLRFAHYAGLGCSPWSQGISRAGLYTYVYGRLLLG